MQLAMGDKLVTLADLKAVYDSMDGGGSGGGDCIYIVHENEGVLDKTAGEIIAAARNKLVILLAYSENQNLMLEVSYLVNIQQDDTQGAGYYTFDFATGIFQQNNSDFIIKSYSATDAESYPGVPAN